MTMAQLYAFNTLAGRSLTVQAEPSGSGGWLLHIVEGTNVVSPTARIVGQPETEMPGFILRRSEQFAADVLSGAFVILPEGEGVPVSNLQAVYSPGGRGASSREVVPGFI